MQTEEQAIPTHLGIIMDGNRRWARDQGLPTLEGHRKGVDNIKTIARHAFDCGVKVMTIYAWSTENWKRTKDEVDYLMDLAVKLATKEMKELGKENVRVVVLGVDDHVPPKVMRAWRDAEEETQDNTGGTIAVCFNYGGTRELVDATKSIVASGAKADDITEGVISEHLYHPEIPEIDLMIRTSGEQRISNFMLWRMRYAEMYFVDKHWPVFSTDDLDEALESFAQRNRRMGGN